MQCANRGRKNLAKRSFMYQSLIASEQLQKGARYERLNPIYVIFICTFDLLGRGYPVYKFDTTCLQNRDILLENEVYAIFLNSKGITSAEDSDLAAFLRYVDGQAAEGEFTKEVDQKIREIKCQEGRRKEYMLLSQEIEWMKEDLLAQGKQEGKIEDAYKLLQLGVPLETVAAGTGLSLEEIQALLKEKK